MGPAGSKTLAGMMKANVAKRAKKGKDQEKTPGKMNRAAMLAKYRKK